MNVVSFISKLDRDTVVFVGSGSSYFFIGTAGRFVRDIKEIEYALSLAPSKLKVTPSEKDKPERDRKPLREREITDCFPRFQRDGYSIIIEGYEVGGFWTTEEFNRSLEKHNGNYIDMILNSRAHCTA